MVSSHESAPALFALWRFADCAWFGGGYAMANGKIGVKISRIGCSSRPNLEAQ
jgi:hypothetical protein